MSNVEGPARLSEDASDLPDDFRLSLAEYRAQGPTREHGEALLAAVLSAQATSKPTMRRTWLKVLLGAGLFVAAGVWIMASSGERASTETPVSNPQIVAMPGPTLVPVPEHSMPPVTEQALPTSPDLPPLRRAETTATRVRERPSEGDAQPRVPERTDEFSLLRRAHRLLPSAPREALSLTEQHAAQHPRGALTEERELLAIEAHVRLGERELATKLARAFAKAHPSSAHKERIRVLLEEPEAGNDASK